MIAIRDLRNVFKNYRIRKYCYKPIKRVQMKITKENDEQESLVSLNMAQQIRARIETTGPITIAKYMKEILTNPHSGYYMLKDVFGMQGDFITSPEINQIFGELIAIWCLSEWKKIGAPKPLQLVELGPGRGSLIQDVLRVFSHFEMQKNISIHLVEISPYMSRLQSQRLCYQSVEVESNSQFSYYRTGESISGVQIFWYRSFEDVPKEFSVVLAHEFFDALPIHKLQKYAEDEEKWKEILVDIDPTDKNSFRYVMSKNETPASKLFTSQSSNKNEKRLTLEVSFESDLLVGKIADRIEQFGGFCLIMDYGHLGDRSDTFRAFKKHKLHDPLIEPGTADLTADVDFLRMKLLCEKDDKLVTFGPIKQMDFLKKMEGETRLKVLIETGNKNVDALKSSYDMLSNPNKMGSRFKFFALFPGVLRDHLKKFPPTSFE